MKKQDLRNALKALEGAKFSKLAAKDVITVITEVRKIRPHVEQLQKDLDMLEMSMEDDMTKEMRSKAKSFETLSEAERMEINEYFISHRRKRNESEKLLCEENVDVELNRFSPEIIENLIASNDFTGQQLSDVFNVFF